MVNSIFIQFVHQLFFRRAFRSCEYKKKKELRAIVDSEFVVYNILRHHPCDLLLVSLPCWLAKATCFVLDKQLFIDRSDRGHVRLIGHRRPGQTQTLAAWSS
jgi:hypothetical protein